MSEIKLLPCPFCGGEAELNRTIVKGRSMYSVSCKHKWDCTIGTTFLQETKEEAIELWNTRKPMERIIDRLEEEKDYMEVYPFSGAKCPDEIEIVKLYKAKQIVKEEGGIE